MLKIKDDIDLKELEIENIELKKQNAELKKQNIELIKENIRYKTTETKNNDRKELLILALQQTIESLEEELKQAKTVHYIKILKEKEDEKNE